MWIIATAATVAIVWAPRLLGCRYGCLDWCASPAGLGVFPVSSDAACSWPCRVGRLDRARSALGVPSIRQRHVTAPLFRQFRKVMPPMSQTEQEALEAGTVWWDAELFTGRPDWHRLLNLPRPHLSADEQAFLDDRDRSLVSAAGRLADHP